MNYDDWKATNRDDERLGRSHGVPVAYRCRDCEWRGKGSIARARHWVQTKHVLLYADDPRFRDEQTKRRTA